MPITGQLLIGYERSHTHDRFHAVDPVLGKSLEPGFSKAGQAAVDSTGELAGRAFDQYRRMDLDTRGRFLDLCADNLVALGDELLERAGQETGLPRARLEGERARTANQLRLFAALVRRQDWLGVRIDHALPDRKPL